MLKEKSTELVASGASITANCQPSLEIQGGKSEDAMFAHRRLLDGIEGPALLLQGNPRVVVSANGSAQELFAKNLQQIEGRRGGQVFDCLHSFSTAGCGLDENCEACTIKGAIVDTLTTGARHAEVTATLPVRKNGVPGYRVLQVATEKVGDLALVRIARYDETSAPPQHRE